MVSSNLSICYAGYVQNAADLSLGSKPAPGDLVWVQGFINTVDLESGRDALGTRDGAAHWLAHHGFIPRGTEVDAAARERVVAFREALRSLLFTNHGDPVEAEAVRTLDAIVASAPLRVAFDADGGAELRAAGTGVDAALAYIAARVYDAMRDGHWERLKACRSDTCRWAFYDASRNRSGAWCTMATCGNRKKVEAYRQRSASED